MQQNSKIAVAGGTGRVGREQLRHVACSVSQHAEHTNVWQSWQNR